MAQNSRRASSQNGAPDTPRPPLYRTATPGPPLSAFVELFWLCEGYAPPHPRERVLPDGTMQVVINLREDVFRVYDPRSTDRCRHLPGSLFCGARTGFVVIDTASQAATVGVHFKPGGALPFLAGYTGALRDVDAPLDALWGAAAGDLRARLLAAATPEAKFRLLERVLLARLARSPAPSPAVAFALRMFEGRPSAQTVAGVAAEIGLSRRRFIEAFSDEVGLTPGLFCRIRRFQQALRHTAGRRRIPWAAVAATCGYCDQAHLIRDFRRFAGLTPTAYLARRSGYDNHVPLLD